MTKILRNALVAAVAVSGLAGSAMAGQQTGCGYTQTDKLWTGRCCGVSEGQCLGGEGGHDHGGSDHSTAPR